MNIQLCLRMFSEADSDFFVLGTEVNSPNLEKQQSSIKNFIKMHYNCTSWRCAVGWFIAAINLHLSNIH